MTDAAHKAWARRMAEEDLMYAVLYPRCRHRVPTAVADAIDVLDVAATIPHHVADADVAHGRAPSTTTARPCASVRGDAPPPPPPAAAAPTSR